MIFNSLHSNYDFKFAWRFLIGQPQVEASQRLSRLLSCQYGGRTWLYYRGRAALAEAVRLTQAEVVLINSFSCYAVEQAVRGVGAQVVFGDIEPQTLSFSVADLEKIHRYQPQLGAVIIQNTLGIGQNIKSILAYCQKHKLHIIEDLAHGLEGQYLDGLKFGQVGDLVVLSFGRDKQIDVVNGGALIVRQPHLTADIIIPSLIKGHLQQRILDRLYPLLSLSVGGLYCLPIFGKIYHKFLQTSGLLARANEGSFLSNIALPSYRSPFVLKQLANLKSDLQRRSHLIGIYTQNLPRQPQLSDQHHFLRYPLLVSAPVRALLLADLKKSKFYLEDTWYDTVVYPDKFMGISTYKLGSCPRREKLGSQIINLPLHHRQGPLLAKKLAKIIKPYLRWRFKTNFTSASWQQARQQVSQDYNFLTTWAEIEALKQTTAQVWLFGLYKDDSLLGLGVVVLMEAKRGRFLKLAGNPLLASLEPKALQIMMAYLRLLAQQTNSVFVRLQPPLLDSSSHRQCFQTLGLNVSPANLNAPHTLKLDLSQLQPKLWRGKVYTNVRTRLNKAQALNLDVQVNNTEQGLDHLLTLLRQTQTRQNFVANNFAYIRAQFLAFQATEQLQLYEVYDPKDTSHKPTVLATALMVDDGHQMFYVYGASSLAGQLMGAPYLLQNHAILEAQRRGLKLYNLWGVSPPQASPKHRFYGVTVFKKNFSRQYFSYLPSYDLIIKPWRYRLLEWWERYQTKRRHL